MHISAYLVKGVSESSSLYFILKATPLPPAGERKQSFQFTVHTESSWNKRNNYVMAAQNDAEMKAWVTAFKVDITYINVCIYTTVICVT